MHCRNQNCHRRGLLNRSPSVLKIYGSYPISKQWPGLGPTWAANLTEEISSLSWFSTSKHLQTSGSKASYKLPASYVTTESLVGARNIRAPVKEVGVVSNTMSAAGV